MRKKKGRIFSNKVILALKTLMACALLFISAFFFFENIHEFGSDFLSFAAPLPILYFAGVAFVCFYIGFLVSRIEDKAFHRSEKFDLIYKIVFSCIMLYIVIRSTFIEPFVGVPIISMISAIVIGTLNWFIPHTTVHESDDF